MGGRDHLGELGRRRTDHVLLTREALLAGRPAATAGLGQTTPSTIGACQAERLARHDQRSRRVRRRRLARTAGAQETEHLTLTHLERDIGGRDPIAEPLRQTLRRYRQTTVTSHNYWCSQPARAVELTRRSLTPWLCCLCLA